MRSRPYSVVTRSELTACFFSLVTLILLFATTARAQSNPIVIENEQPGTLGWQISNKVANDSTGQIKGYASATSVNKGGSITLYVSTNPAQTFTMDVYRIGWYQGLGGRLMLHVGSINSVTQPTCPRDSTTGMVECDWAPTYTLATQASWTSGVYVALLTNTQGYQNYISFVLRDDSRVAALRYNQPILTAQAYNNYPDNNSTGKSLYEYNSFGPNVPATGTTRAAKVSFDRPFADSGVTDFWSTGQINFIRWMERSGYDVTYATDVDTHTDGSRLLDYHGNLFVGHPEYYSKQMYDAVVSARDAGVNLGFFAADSIYWQIRMEPSSNGVPNRVVVCYKDAARDPIADPTLKTVLWRESPLNRPEQAFVGLQYTSQTPFNNGYYTPYVVTNSSNWVYAGTGLHDGDSLIGLVGYEADRVYPEYPTPDAVPGTYTLLSNSPYQSVQGPDHGNTTVYQAQSQAWVFATGTMNWSWALDSEPWGLDHGNYPPGVVDTRIQQMAANILDRFSAGILPDFRVTADPATQTVAPGNSISYSVTITPSNGFSNAVTLSVSGLPTGAAGTFTPNPATGTATLVVTTSGSTPLGSYPLTITGVSGTLTHTTTATLGVSIPDFSLSATPATQGVLQGASANYSVTINPTSGFSNAVTLSVSGLPNGATGTFTPNPATGSSTLAVTTGGATPVGSYPLTITGVSGGLNHTTAVSLSVVSSLPPPGVVFDAVGPGPGGASVASGSSLSWDHTVAATGLNRLLTVAVAVGTSPDTGKTLAVTYNGVAMTSAGIVHSNNQTAGFGELFYLTAPATGTHPVQVTLSGGTASLAAGSSSFTGVDQTTPLRNTATSFGSNASPQVAVTSAAGNMVLDALVTGCDGNIVSSKTLSWMKQVNCSTGAGNAAQSTAVGAGSVTMGYSVPSDWWGMIGADIVAAAGQAAFDFSLGNEGNKTVAQGSAVTNTVTASLSAGVTQSATFSASGLPTGATASFNQPSCSPTCGTTMTINASASAALGTWPITVTATAGAVSRTTNFTLNITAGEDFALSATPPSQTIQQGASGNYDVTINPANGFNSAVTLSVSGLPAGATGTFTPNPGTASSTLAVTMGASTPAGTYPLTITGVSGTLTHTTSVSLTVSLLPDFALSATPPSQTLEQGASGNYSVTVNPTDGFNGAVTFSVGGLPAGATSSFTPNPGTASSTLAVTVGGSTPAGTYPLTITGVSGTLTHTTSVSLTVSLLADFGLSATPPSQTVQQGASGNYSVTISPSNGFSSAVTLSLSGLPAGATSSFTPNPGTASSTLAVTMGGSTPAGTYPLTITGVSGTLTHTTTVSLSVPVPDFGLSATPASQTIEQGASGNYAVTVNPSNGFNSAVTFSVSGLPAGTTGSFTPNPGTGSSTLALTVGGSTPAGTYPLTITGVSGTLTHTTTVSLDVSAASVPDFGLTATPPSQTVQQGASGNYSVTVNPSNGFNSAVTFSVSGLPAGATGGFTPNPATGSSTLAVTMGGSTPAGTYPLTITGVSGTLTHTTTVSLTVPVPDFGLSATPPSQTLEQGASGNYSVTVNPSNGFNSAVTFSLSGLPAGATSSFTPNPATGSSTLAVTVGGSTPAGTYPLTVTGVSGTLTHTTTVSLTVSLLPDFGLSATPPSQTIQQGASGNYSVTVSPTNGFSSAVTFSVSGLPAGATGGFTPNPATASSTLAVTVGGSTPAGTYPLTITGVSGTLTHTTTVSLTVPVPDFALGATPPSQTIQQGASGNYSVTVSPTNGFNGAVTFSVSGLPTGATSGFTPNPGTASSTLAVTMGGSTPAGTYPLTITGVSGTLTHTTTVSLTVPTPPDFGLSATPPSQTIQQGASGNYGVTVSPTNGFNSAVTFSVSGLPTGATSGFTPNPGTASSTLAVTVGGSTPAGTYPLTITGVSGTLTHTTTVSLTVPVPDFALSATPSSQTLQQGASGNYGVTISPTNGFNSAVTFSVSGLPAGATGTFTPNPATGSSTLTVTTSGSTPLGTYPLTITGVNGTLTHTTAVSLTVTAVIVPDFGLSATPPSQTVVQGTPGNYGVTISPANGFNSAVTLSVSGLPTGATGTFTPNPATGSSTLAVSTSASTPVGTYPLTITGVSGSLSHTAAVSLSVMTSLPPPGVVTFDAVGPGSGGASVTSGSSLTWDHTVTASGSNRLLTVGVVVGTSPDTGKTLAVTYNGVAMTPAGIVHSNNQTAGYGQLFYLIAPATGTHPVQVTLTGGTASLEAGSLSFTGVDQTTPLRNVATSFGSNASPQVAVTSATGNVVVDVLATGCDGNIVSNKTLSWLKQVNCSTGGGIGAQSVAAGASSVTMGYSVPSDWWGMIGADIVAASGQPAVDFALSNEGNKSVTQGSAVTNTITASLLSGLSQSATFSASGLPTGATASFSQPSCSPTCSTTLTINAGASAAVGTWPITVTATAGSVIRTTNFTLNVAAPTVPEFSLSATPASQTLQRGSSGNYGVTISPTNGFNSAVTLSVSGLPAGATGTFTPNPATASSTLAVTTGASTPAGTYPLTITGVSGTLTHTTTVSLTVTVPDFSLSATPASQTLQRGASGNYGVTINPTNGFSSAVTLSVSGLPTGATGTFTPNPATASSTLAVTTAGTTPAGTYPLTITGVSGTLTHTTTVSLTVTAPDFSLSATPASQTLQRGASGNYGVTISPTNGFSSAVTLSVSGLPTGATGTFTPNPATASATLAVTTAGTTPAGTYPLTITGVSGTLTHTTTVSLTVVVPDFGLSATPASQTLLQGASGNYSVTISPTNGFSSAVTLSVSGLPTGATGTFTPNPATGSSTLAVTVGGSTAVGTYPLTITGVSGSLSHTAAVSLSVVSSLPPAGVAFDVVGPSAAGASVASGSSLSWNHTITPTGLNRLLTVVVAVGVNPDTSRTLAVTYNGVAMTSAGIVHSNNRTAGFAQLFYLVAPATGTHAVQVTLTGGNASLEAGSTSFTGVDQTTPLRNVLTSFGSNASPQVTVPSALGNMVVDALVTGCDGNIVSNKTLSWVKQVNCSTGGGNGAQSVAAGGSSVTMGYSVPSDWWGMIGADIVAAP